MNTLSPARREGRVFALAVGERAGAPKRLRNSIQCMSGRGVMGDRPLSQWISPVGLVSWEILETAVVRGIQVWPGFCGESICTESIDFDLLGAGSMLRIGEALLVVSKKGRTCNRVCRKISDKAECPVTRDWLFTRVLRGGHVRVNDPVRIIQAAEMPLPD